MQQMVQILRVVCVCVCDCGRQWMWEKSASYSELENVFSERNDSVFWDKILMIIDGINVALQSKTTSLVCVTKFLEGLKSTLGLWGQNIGHDSISEYLSIAWGLSTKTNFSSRQARAENFKDRKKFMEFEWILWK
jgi:hypothetical protein